MTDTTERVDYHFLDQRERAILEDWLRAQGIEPARTPVDPLIDYDPVHDEWRIEQFWVDANGRKVLAEFGQDVRRVIVRRRRRDDLPWPSWDQKFWQLWDLTTSPEQASGDTENPSGGGR